MTLKDIAKEAGVSITTVSNVINKNYNRVSQNTIDKVSEIVKKNNYAPNMNAKTLAAKNSNLIFLIVPLSNNEVNMFYTPYISDMIGMLEQRLREHGFYSIIRSVHTFEELDTLFQTWTSAGAIMLLPDFDCYIDQIMEKINIPIVFMDSCNKRDDTMIVTCDNKKGMYTATRYLIGQGHTNIAFMADFKHSEMMTERFNGYAEALKENGIPINEEFLFQIPPSHENGLKVGRDIANNHKNITGIVTTSDYSAIGIMEGARLSGFRIPSQLSIIGFDNMPFCTYCLPKLTTISQNIEQKAISAVEMLTNKINGKLSNNKVVVDVELIERQSVANLLY